MRQALLIKFTSHTHKQWLMPFSAPVHRGSSLSDIVSAVQVICHGIPDQRPLQDGDIVNVDVSAYYKGFHGDLNETIVVGEVDDDSKRLIRTTLEASQMPLLTGTCGPGKEFMRPCTGQLLQVVMQGLQDMLDCPLYSS